ncbi:MAG: nucleoside hydrolase [Anaerolineales bacterium]|nr:nucleoside hydrolase [Anaerolineales bacterium]
MHRLIIDTDPGVDDAHAILMALAHPNARVEAITVVAGNVGLEHTAPNALKILDVAGADVPVYRGAAGPLVLPSENAAGVHGADGLGDAGLPVSSRHFEAEHAANALVRLANAEPGALTLIAIGPLTNLALAVRLDPELPGKFKKLVVMGGAIHSRGNTSTASAEFNIFADPEAAHVVFSTWPRLTLVSWETTLAHGFSAEVVQRFFKLGTPRAEFFRRTNEKLITYVTEVLGREMLFAPDGLAMAVALEPEIVKHAEVRPVTIELHGRHTRGQTVIDWLGRGGKPANVEIVLEVDLQRFISLMELGLR